MDISVTPPGGDDQGNAEKIEAAKVEAPHVEAEKPEAETAEAKSSAPEITAGAETSQEAPAKADAATPAEPEPIKAARVEPAAATVQPPTGALIPFVAPEPREPAEDSHHRARFDRLLGYGAHAALIVALVGFAWALSSYFIRGFTPASPQAAAKPNMQAVALATERADKTQFQHTAQVMAAEIRTLKSSIEGLRTAAARAPTQDQLRGLERTVDGLKLKLEAAKTETNAALAQVTAKVEHVQGEPAAKLREVNERIERLERQAAPITTASITPAPAATVSPAKIHLPPTKVAQPKTAITPTKTAAVETAEAARRPQLVANWVVRDVYDGIALVEGPRGMLEVVAGETIPGVGAVKSIERRGNGWIVVTNRGMIEFARD